jgi:hypothetical protein
MVYGSLSSDLAQVTEALARVLGVEFTLHNSMYRGGDYYRYESEGGGVVRVERNHDLIDDEPAASQWPEISVLIYLDAFPQDVCRLYADRLEQAAASIGVQRLK